MGCIEKYREKERFGITGYALLILPAVALGILAMIQGGVSPALWGQQAGAWVIFALLASALRRAASRIPSWIWMVLLLIPLTATLFADAVGGARRWLDLGVFHANAAMLVLPALLIVLYRIECPYPALLGAAVVLSVQPDLSQLTAFSAAALPILWLQRRKRIWKVLSVLILSVLVLVCMRMPTALEPVSDSEGILAMLGEMSWLLQAAGWLSLAVIPVYWLYGFCRQGSIHMLSLSVYYAVMILFVLSGEYPVPFAGFGLSPIAGYYLAYVCAEAAAQKDECM